MTEIKRIFICGPISGDHITFLNNIKEGTEVSARLIQLGYSPYCPHVDFLYHFTSITLTLDQYRNHCKPWLEVSDAVLLVRESQNVGVVDELKMVAALDKPLFHGLQEFEMWHFEKERIRKQIFTKIL